MPHLAGSKQGAGQALVLPRLPTGLRHAAQGLDCPLQLPLGRLQHQLAPLPARPDLKKKSLLSRNMFPRSLTPERR